MRNNLDSLLHHSSHSSADTVAVARRLTNSFWLTRKILSRPGGEDPYLRLALIAAFIDLVADGVDPCKRLISEITGIPQEIIAACYEQRAQRGVVNIVKLDHRDVYVVAREHQALPTEAMQIIDLITSRHRADLHDGTKYPQFEKLVA